MMLSTLAVRISASQESLVRTTSFLALVLLLSALPQSAASQLSGPRTPAGCIDLTGSPHVTAEGRLSLRSYPGRPNYQSIADGDEEERVFILELPASVCIDDGGHFTDPGEPFRTVHIFADSPQLIRRLRSAVGRRVAVTGEGFGEETGHHHAPLVIIADSFALR